MGRFERCCRCEGDFIDLSQSELFKKVCWNALRSIGLADPRRPRTRSDAIAALCGTPRLLKHFLRRSDEVWSNLRGEIDLDDVLLMGALRVGEPEVFAQVEINIESLRGGDKGRFQLNRKLPKQGVRGSSFETWLAQWGERQQRDDPARGAAVNFVLEQVFGRVQTQAEVGTHREPPRDKLQGLAQPPRDNADYWQRFQAVPKIREEDGDQHVLKLTRGHDLEALSKLLAHTRHSPTIAHFSGSLNDDDRCDLLLRVFDQRLPESPSSWPLDALERGDKQPPGLYEAFELLNRRPVEPDRLTELIKGLVDRAVEQNLGLLRSVLRGTTNLPLAASQAQDLRRHGWRCFARSYQGVDELLAKRLDDLPHQFLLELSRVDRSEAVETPPTGWHDFVPTLLDAALRNRLAILPQLAQFATKPAGPDISGPWQVDVALGKRWFGDHWDTIVDLFGGPPVEALKGNAQYQAMRTAARARAARAQGQGTT